MAHKFDNVTDKQFAAMDDETKGQYIAWLKAGKAAAEANQKPSAVLTAKYRNPAELYDTQEKGPDGKVVKVKAPGKGTIILYGIRQSQGIPAYYPSEWLKIFAAQPLVMAEMEKHKASIAAQEEARKASKGATAEVK